jgi:hypothetical protein
MKVPSRRHDNPGTVEQSLVTSKASTRAGKAFSPFTAHEKIERRIPDAQFCMGQARVVPSQDYFRLRGGLPADRHYLQGAFVLETHAADPDQFGTEFFEKSPQPGADILVNQHQIGNFDLMAGKVSGNRAEPQARHLDYPVEVIGRIRHGQE